MTKKELIQEIEAQGIYCNVTINKDGYISGRKVNEPIVYNKDTNKGGRIFLGHIKNIEKLLTNV